MEYITVKEAAKKWNISERLVQKYCAQGHIGGAKKFGVSWGIPQNAVKPADPRKKEESSSGQRRCQDIGLLADLMPLMSAAFEPGCCRQYIRGMEEGPQKEIAIAEYYYFSGQPEEAVKRAELYLNSSDMALRLSACLLFSYANLTIGQIHRAKYALNEVRSTLAAGAEKGSSYLRAAESFVAVAATVLLHLPLPDQIPEPADYLPLLPMGLQIFSLYVMAHYTYLQGQYEKSLGIIEATLALQAENYPIPAIYLHLAAVMDYMSLRKPEQAEKHLLAAWTLAKPDDLIEAFGEHHGLLGGMLEAVIKQKWPQDFKRIISITYRFSKGWRKVHNPVTGHEVADNLTTTEFAAAMLAARGWTNREIGEHMNISANTVKHYISSALQKLNIKHRQELKKYMLQ